MSPVAGWPDLRLTELLGIAHPIIQAPMKGTSTPELAAAVSNAGGLGSLGCAGLDPPALRALAGEMRRRTNRAFNLNFFALGAVVADPDALARARARLDPFYAEKGLGAPPDHLDPAPAAFSDDHLAALLADPPPVVSFHFGLPPGDAVPRLRAAGARVLCTATTVAEASALDAAGVERSSPRAGRPAAIAAPSPSSPTMPGSGRWRWSRRSPTPCRCR